MSMLLTATRRKSMVGLFVCIQERKKVFLFLTSGRREPGTRAWSLPGQRSGFWRQDGDPIDRLLLPFQGMEAGGSAGKEGWRDVTRGTVER